MNCIICGKPVPKGRRITCSHNCSIKYLWSNEYQRLQRKKREKKINNRCPVCNKLIGEYSMHCIKHNTRYRNNKRNIYKYKDNRNKDE